MPDSSDHQALEQKVKESEKDADKDTLSRKALKLNEERLESLLKLHGIRDLSEKEMVEYSLEEAVRLTNSEIGYLHFVDPDQRNIKLYSWSKEALKNCAAEKTPHYPLDKAGVWADCIRLKEPVIHNDYQNFPAKKGYPEGHSHIIRHASVPVWDDNKIVAIVGVGNKAEPYDHTDVRQLSLFANSMWEILNRKRAEEALQQSESMRRGMFLAAPVGISVVKDRKFIDTNNSFCNIVGYDKSELIGNTTRMLYESEAESTRVGDELYADLWRQGFASLETRHIRKDGEVRDVVLRAAPIRPDNPSAGVVVAIEDITERKQSEEALKKSEKQYRFLAENVKDVIWTRDMNLNLTYISPSVFEQQGFTVAEAMVRPVEETWTPDSFKRYMEVLKEELEIEKKEQKDMTRSRTIEGKVRCKDGSIVWTEAKTAFLRDSSGVPTGIIGVTRDITKRKQVEEALKQSEERYRSLVENTIYGFFIHEIPSGRFLFFNQRARELFGYTMSEGLQLTVWDVLAPEDHERIKRRVQARAAGNKLGPDIQTYTAIRKDGATFRLEVSSSLITFQGRPAVQGIIQDVTEQERLEQQLKQAQKMEALGTLAGGVAHDFNNLLMGIQGRTSLMLMSSDLSHSSVEHLRGIEEYIKSAADLTRQLLGFARGGKYEVKATELNELIHNQNRMFGRTRKEINIREKFQENVWTVEVDRRQIEQVLLNIYINAWQAMPGGGDLYVQTENIIVDEDYSMPYLVEPGKYVKISITDTGVGMNETTRERVFDPFFTTKGIGRGTGLGLASAYGIIKNHNGFINIYSEKGKGTTINCYLPASGKAAVMEKEVDEELVSGTETILLVDDEDMIIDVGREIIERLGYRVLSSKSGKEAVEMYEENRDRIDMIILDMIMPNMDGGETYDRLKKINPDIKVLLSSGYSINGQAAEILERGCNGFIQKPFNMVVLSKKIREVLGGD